MIGSRTPQLLSWLELHRETKVGELDVPMIVQENVLRFQIPVDNVQGVEVLHSLQQSSHYTPAEKQNLHGFGLISMYQP